MSAAPETLRQARRWDENAKRNRRAGMHDDCAAQAAWGRQLGASNVRPVCDECAAMSRALDGLTNAASLPAYARPASLDPATLGRATSEAEEAA
jgi:hypothetical protein